MNDNEIQKHIDDTFDALRSKTGIRTSATMIDCNVTHEFWVIVETNYEKAQTSTRFRRYQKMTGNYEEVEAENEEQVKKLFKSSGTPQIKNNLTT